jgi:hypothetical protein
LGTANSSRPSKLSVGYHQLVASLVAELPIVTQQSGEEHKLVDQIHAAVFLLRSVGREVYREDSELGAKVALGGLAI